MNFFFLSFLSLFQKKIPERRNSDETFINYILEAMEDVQVGEVCSDRRRARGVAIHEIRAGGLLERSPSLLLAA